MIRIGVICPSEIAFRRFMPAIMKAKEFEFVGLGVCTAEERFGDHWPSDGTVKEILSSEKEKAQKFVDLYGGEIFSGYGTIAASDKIDALYIPLPPSLHFKWAMEALRHNKHVLVEKPATISTENTIELVKLAKEKSRALHENYMFAFHNQIREIDHIIENKEIGDVRLYRVSFGFPLRSSNDFRYKKELGGGALIDAGGYTIKYAAKLLGITAKIAYAHMNYTEGYEVDMYGSAALINDDGVTVQISYGMDNSYKCDLEVWGNKGCLTTNRILTAPENFIPEVTIRKENKEEKRQLSSDDSFSKSIQRFYECISSEEDRCTNYEELIKQAQLVEEFKILAKR